MYGKKYPFYVEYISNANVTPKAIIEKFERKGYVVEKYYGNPSQEVVFELKKIRGSYKDNLSCTVYIRNNTELEIKYQYTT